MSPDRPIFTFYCINCGQEVIGAKGWKPPVYTKASLTEAGRLLTPESCFSKHRVTIELSRLQADSIEEEAMRRKVNFPPEESSGRA